MRSTLELIHELRAEAQGAMMTALVVDCADSTLYVWASDENALEMLNEAVDAGGNPLGFISVVRNGDRLDVGAWPLAEFRDDEEVIEPLKQLALRIAFKLDERGQERLV